MNLMKFVGVVVRTPYPWMKAYGLHLFIGSLAVVVAMFWLLFRVETAEGRRSKVV